MTLDGREIRNNKRNRNTKLKYKGRTQKYLRKYGKENVFRERMGAATPLDTRWLQDNVLKNFLKSRIGKNWDDVYSELVKRKLPYQLMSWLDFFVEKTYDNVNTTDGIKLYKGDLYICYKTNRLMEK